MTAASADALLRSRMSDAVLVGSIPVTVVGTATLESPYPVSDFAAATIATTGAALGELLEALDFGTHPVVIRRELADAWFGSAVRGVGWSPPDPWDPIAGDYRGADGWIRVHTNAAAHRAAALRVLGVGADRERVADAVNGWDVEDLEAEIVLEGGCAAVMRTVAEWTRHPQGEAVAAEPLVASAQTDLATSTSRWAPSLERPLAGLRVLDLTRVLAGPAATRMLAGFGADVLRIDPTGWDEPAVVPEMTLGKRAARLDAHDPAGLGRLTELLAEADVIVHGYRSDALERLGFGDEVRAAARPGLVDVSLDAYGHSGPWAARRGFDSLVQMSSGIADAGMRAAAADRPTPLPVQALDHGTGYLVAAAVLAGLRDRVTDGVGTRARLSLARTALELEAARGLPRAARFAAPLPQSHDSVATPWGVATVLPAPLEVAGVRIGWERPPRALGTDAPSW